MGLEDLQLNGLAQRDRERVRAILPKIEEREIYSTIGVYNDGTRVKNGVNPDHLERHIEDNLRLRFGRALFLEGKCLNSGYLSRNRIKALELEFKGNPNRPEAVSEIYR